jgi:hypothetical protein
MATSRSWIGRERPPARHRRVPRRALRRPGPAGEPLEGRVVRSDHPRPRAALDRHVAQGHPRLHRERADRGAGVLDDVAGPAAHADLRDDREDEVLRAHARPEATFHADREGPRAALEEALGGEDVPDLGGPDPEGEGAERAVGGGVAVAADDGHARLRRALLRPEDVDDALRVVLEPVQLDPEVARVPLEEPDLRLRLRVHERPGAVRAAREGRDGVVHRREGPLRAAHPEPALAQEREGLRARHLVHEVEVHVEDRRGLGGLGPDHVRVPDLPEERARARCVGGPAHGVPISARASLSFCGTLSAMRFTTSRKARALPSMMSVERARPR